MEIVHIACCAVHLVHLVSLVRVLVVFGALVLGAFFSLFEHHGAPVLVDVDVFADFFLLLHFIRSDVSLQPCIVSGAGSRMVPGPGPSWRPPPHGRRASMYSACCVAASPLASVGTLAMGACQGGKPMRGN